MEIVLLFIIGLVSVGLGGLVVTNQYKNWLGWHFFVTTICLTIWSVGVGVFLLLSDESTMRVVAQTYYIAAAGIAAFVLLSAIRLAYPRAKSTVELAVIPTFLVLAGSIILSPNILINSIDSIDGRNIVTLNLFGYALYTLYFVVYYAAAVLILMRAYRQARYTVSRIQLRYMIHAYVWAGLVGMLFNLWLPAIGNYQYIWAGPLGIIIFVAVVYATIARHGLFDIKVAAVRTAAYGLSVATLTIMYFGLAYALSMTVFGQTLTTGVSLSPVNILIALVMALTFQPVKRFFDRITNNIFFRDRYDTSDFITQHARILTSTTSLRTLLERSASHIESAMKVSHSTFVVFRDGREDTVASTKPGTQLNKDERGMVANLVGDRREVQLVDDLEKAIDRRSDEYRAVRLLRRRNVAAILPLSSKVGYVLLGDQKVSGYTKRDVRVLNAVSDELLIAIQNVRSIQEVRDLNMNLQQRIDAATRELRSTNEKLRALDATKDEFISMASHQLRTPLTGIKGYVSMVLEGDAGKITDKQRQLLEQAFGSSERMVRLISDFLNVSRLQTGKFVIDAHPTNLTNIVQEEVESLRQLAESHSLQLSCSVPKYLPELMIDGDKLRQVIMNFIDNAIYYSPDRSTIAVKLLVRGDDVVLEVHDRGIGVPADVQKKLFTKFFRADNARKQRPDGTGVGLFLAKKVVTAMHGSIVFESREGKGSVFGFRLPINKLRVD